jgi:hypothetical protein
MNYHESISTKIARKNGDLVIEDIHTAGKIRITTPHWITVSKPRLWQGVKGRPTGGYKRDDLYSVYRACSYVDLIQLLNSELDRRVEPPLPFPGSKQVTIQEFFVLAQICIKLKLISGSGAPLKKRVKPKSAPISLKTKLAAIRDRFENHEASQCAK